MTTLRLNVADCGSGSSVRKGEFIEETLGVAQREDILQNGTSIGKHGAINLSKHSAPLARVRLGLYSIHVNSSH